MRKVRLDLESLAVETFSTTGKTGSKGTVLGHDSLGSFSGCPSATCPEPTDGCDDPVLTGFDVNSLSGCAHCVCPLLLSPAGQTSRC